MSVPKEPRLTREQSRRVRELVEDEGHTRASARAWVLAFEPARTSPGYAPASALKAGDEIEGEDEETGRETRLTVTRVGASASDPEMLEVLTSDGKRSVVGRDDVVLVLAPVAS